MAERAIFISRVAALKAVVQVASKHGVDNSIIMQRGRAHPVYRRGELCGYEAWFPASVDHNSPVMEGMI